jgi:hypothetical protein
MAAKNEKDLSDQQRGSWLKAVAAIELRNFGYAIDLLQNLLKQNQSSSPAARCCGALR